MKSPLLYQYASAVTFLEEKQQLFSESSKSEIHKTGLTKFEDIGKIFSSS